MGAWKRRSTSRSLKAVTSLRTGSDEMSKGCNMSNATAQMVFEGPRKHTPHEIPLPEYTGKKSPSALTVQMFQEYGCKVVKLEKWIPRTNIRQDVWGADFLVRQGEQLLAIQATDETSHSKRVTKCVENKFVPNWLETGVLFFVYSWGLKGERGSKHWKLRITQLVMEGNKVIAI